jgi:hypothetical protein
MSSEEIERLIPAADAEAVGLGVGRRSIGRYLKNPPPGFPRAVRMNKRLYFKQTELESYKRRLSTRRFPNQPDTPSRHLQSAGPRKIPI